MEYRLHLFRSISEKSAFPGKNVVHEMDLMTDLLGKPSMDTISRAYQAQFFIVRTEDKIFAEISESLDVNCRITYKDQEAWRKRLLSLVKIKTTWDILGAKLTWRESKRTVICESGGKVGLVVKGKRVCFGTIFRNGVLAKLERYHDLGPWFYCGINNSGLGGSSMMLSSVYVRPNWFRHHCLFESQGNFLLELFKELSSASAMAAALYWEKNQCAE
ncbi:hypothetical protein F2Q68_00019996 [Brassica cretica]|uniref:Uncharacterized protein n=1 Tax=Brassica cretica TaxID=69181 RepID=A0A8S9G0E2_BRACR|nr:hypothetical protein F2Q68_00019996 [Brassica cretica]